VAYQASGTLGVSLPPARHSAPPRYRLRFVVAFYSFGVPAPPSISERDDTWQIDGLLIKTFTEMGVLAGAGWARRLTFDFSKNVPENVQIG